MSDFSDRPLVAGSVTGLRSFRVDSLGRLAGVHYQDVFKPGVNRARCGKGIDVSPTAIGIGTSAISTRTSQEIARVLAAASAATYSTTMETRATRKPPPPKVSLTKKPKHRVGNVGCACGFYAYFDTDGNPHHSSDQALALVEGTGTVTVGTRGFRAEKAKLVALVKPTEDDVVYQRPGDKLAERFYNKDFAVFVSTLATISSGTLIALAWSGAASLWQIPIASVVLVASLVTLYLTFRAITVHHDHRRIKSDGVSEERWALIRRNYPDVPVYPSLAAALKEHPLTPPPPPPVPSPADDDFWTRAVSS